MVSDYDKAFKQASVVHSPVVKEKKRDRFKGQIVPLDASVVGADYRV